LRYQAANMSLPILHADNEWRFDPLDERWTLLAHNRRTLPPIEAHAPASERALREHAPCVFCEDGVTGPLDRLHGEDGRTALAFPSPTPLTFVEHGAPPTASYSAHGALGAHEIVVAEGASHHALGLAEADPEMLGLMLALAVRRLGDLAGDHRLRSARLALLPPARCRLPHLHLALLATPMPARHNAGSCLVCRELEQARAHGRVLLSDDGVTAWVPWAPRGDLHIRIAPEEHGPAWLRAGERAATAALARRVFEAARALDRVAPGVDLVAAAQTLSLSDPGSQHPVVDVEAAHEADDALARALDVRVATCAPEELAQRLRQATGEALKTV
jgi:galactose-1-phosphate uridylyltransferase